MICLVSSLIVLCINMQMSFLNYSDLDVQNLVEVLEKDSKSFIHWFHLNKMQATPDKFQAMEIGSKTLARVSFLILVMLKLCLKMR